jgi:hypothetical protein
VYRSTLMLCSRARVLYPATWLMCEALHMRQRKKGGWSMAVLQPYSGCWLAPAHAQGSNSTLNELYKDTGADSHKVLASSPALGSNNCATGEATALPQEGRPSCPLHTLLPRQLHAYTTGQCGLIDAKCRASLLHLPALTWTGKLCCHARCVMPHRGHADLNKGWLG